MSGVQENITTTLCAEQAGEERTMMCKLSVLAFLRGVLADIGYHLGFFHADKQNNILFQTTGRATGLFANVDKTRRPGFGSTLNGSIARLACN